MIRFERRHASTYAGADRADAVRASTCVVPEGELCLVVGRTGSGKSTLLRTVNGLVPHFTGGTLTGRVTVAGRDTRTHPPRELADVVGVVGQDPVAGFVTDIVEDELAYGMESLGLPAARSCAAGSRRRSTCSAWPSCATARCARCPAGSGSGSRSARCSPTHPRVLVLDEPTSALDPGAAEEVLAALQRLVHDLGLTVVLAEHRLERVVQYADRVVLLTGAGGRVEVGDPATVMARSPVAPAGGRARAASPAGTRCRCRCATPGAPPARCATGSRLGRPAPAPVVAAPARPVARARRRHGPVRRGRSPCAGCRPRTSPPARWSR